MHKIRSDLITLDGIALVTFAIVVSFFGNKVSNQSPISLTKMPVCYKSYKNLILHIVSLLFTTHIIASTFIIHINNGVSNDTGQHQGFANLHHRGSSHTKVIVHHIYYPIHLGLEVLVVTKK
jgi:hypothetical protein